VTDPGDYTATDTTSGRSEVGKAAHVLASPKDRVYLSIIHRAILIATDGGNQLRMLLHTAGRLTAMTEAAWQPLVLEVADLICDSEQDSTLTLTVAADRTVAVWRATTSDWVRYESLHDVLAAWPTFAAGAEVRLVAEIRSDADDTYSFARLTGTVETIENVTPASITFRVEQVDVLRLTQVPSATLHEIPTTYTNAELTVGADKAVVPIHLGAFVAPIAGFDDDEALWYCRNAAVFGLSQPRGEAAPWFSSVSATGLPSLGFAYTRKIGDASPTYGWGGYFIEVGGGRLARVYANWNDNGNWWPGWPGIIDDSAEEHRVLTLGKFPWVQVPIPVDRVDGFSTVEGCDKATDGDPGTYAVLLPGQSLTFEVQNVSLPGRLCNNSTDAGTNTDPGEYPTDLDGAGKPVGLKVAVLLACPDLDSVQDPGTDAAFRVFFTFPDGTPWAGCAGAYQMPRPTDAPRIRTCELNLPFGTAVMPGNAGAGWCNTKFAQGDFTTDADEDATTLSFSDGANQPFRVTIHNEHPTASAYVSSVGLIAGCKFSGKGLPVVVRFGRVAGFNPSTGRTTFEPAYSRGERGLPYAYGRGVDLIPEKFGDPIAQISTCFQFYIDDASGNATGTPGAGLTDPLHFLRFLLHEEGGVAYSNMVTTAGLFGASEDVADMLSKWWASNNVDSVGWPMNFSLTSQVSLREALSSIGEHCLGLTVRRLPSGKYGFFLRWAPVDLIGESTNKYWSGASGDRVGDRDGAILVGRQILSARAGCAVELLLTPVSQVYNRVEIRYGHDLKRVAWADHLGSDDGTGAAWGRGGYAPFSNGLTVAYLASWSASIYGIRPMPPISLPFVESPQVAVQVGLYYFLRAYRQGVLWQATGNAGLLEVTPGHVLRFDDDLFDRSGMRFPVDEGDGDWATKACLVERAEYCNDRGVYVQMSGIVLPTRFEAKIISGGYPDQTPWGPPEEPPAAGDVITVGAPWEGHIDRDDETFPNPNETG
jgi:hypothetical protein